jgi:hypothetical protein
MILCFGVQLAVLAQVIMQSEQLGELSVLEHTIPKHRKIPPNTLLDTKIEINGRILSAKMTPLRRKQSMYIGYSELLYPYRGCGECLLVVKTGVQVYRPPRVELD